MPSWANLNERQQQYLQAIYETDQEQEADERSVWKRGGTPRPAREWRWMEYGVFSGVGSTLCTKLYLRKLIDEGTGSTFEALERRGLVLCNYEPDSIGGPFLFVQITRAGRKMVREALAIASAKKLPVGTLREWHWRALCRAYIRGEQGMGYDKDTSNGFGYVSWNTCLRLRDYTIKGQDMALIREGRRGEQFALVITEFGKQFYRENWRHYCELYPEVDAPEPESDK